jgi:hypothetical protein
MCDLEMLMKLAIATVPDTMEDASQEKTFSKYGFTRPSLRRNGQMFKKIPEYAARPVSILFH